MCMHASMYVCTCVHFMWARCKMTFERVYVHTGILFDLLILWHMYHYVNISSGCLIKRLTQVSFSRLECPCSLENW